MTPEGAVKASLVPDFTADNVMAYLDTPMVGLYIIRNEVAIFTRWLIFVYKDTGTIEENIHDARTLNKIELESLMAQYILQKGLAP